QLFAGILFHMGGADAAVALLEEGQRRHPGDFWLNHRLAFLLSELKPPRTADAIGYYRAALALRPDSPGVYVNLGNALESARQWPEAIAAFRKAVELKGDYATAHVNLAASYAGFALSLEKQGKLPEATAAFRK